MARIILSMIMGSLLWFGMSASAADKPKPGDSISINDLPDLTATITFSYTTSVNANNVLCYNTVPHITIINQGGRLAAKDFTAIAEWNYGPNHSWQLAATSGNHTLKSGETFTMCGQPVCNITWCTGEPVKPAWRVTVDPTNVVKERNEHNNRVVKSFQPPLIREIK